MVNIDDIRKYELYLQFLEKKLKSFFEEQAPYIYCKEGCSYCCEKGEYPFSEIEFAYLMMGVRALDAEIVRVIENNIIELKKQKELSNPDKPFMHQCPFLVNKRCSLYNFRGIICRSHGLAFFSRKGKLMVPACVDLGLNYSSVYDFDTGTISNEKYQKSGIKQEPLAHNVGVHYLTNNDFLKSIGLDFGEIKPMLYWFG